MSSFPPFLSNQNEDWDVFRAYAIEHDLDRVLQLMMSHLFEKRPSNPLEWMQAFMKDAQNGNVKELARPKSLKQQRMEMDDVDEDAVVRIQAHYRGHKTRKSRKGKKGGKSRHGPADEQQSAVKIQARVRGRSERKKHKIRVDQRKEEEKAATNIQANFRGHKTRKQMSARTLVEGENP
eukprot:GFYU01006272.1.p1 GENE.GFYU01006272.1~~GFYU01006272.1.p1  ORF type:complete len:179 (+),score=55.63 GFYU01006272.1:163-699(+)